MANLASVVWLIQFDSARCGFLDLAPRLWRTWMFHQNLPLPCQKCCFFLAIGCYWLLQLSKKLHQSALTCAKLHVPPLLPRFGFVTNPRQPSRLHSWGAWGNQPETPKPSLRSFRPCEVQLFELVKARYHCCCSPENLVKKNMFKDVFLPSRNQFFFHKDSKSH